MYDSFAYVYDEFMEDVPYEKWALMLRDILAEDGIDDGLLLDLGCGTGTLTRLMADYGYDMTGVDISPDMLTVAREYSENGMYTEEGEEKPDADTQTDDTHNILYLCQDMREFELYGTVRAVYSLCDSINYITEYDDLVKVFKLVNNYLDPGGIFIFDMNTIYKFETVLGDNTFAENGEDASFIWENGYDEESRINEYYLTLFVEEEDGRYTKETEVHRQKGYTVDEVKNALEASGLIFERVCDEDTGKEITAETERMLFVARESGK